MFKLYYLIVFISIFGLNTYGEDLNLYGQVSYLLLTLANVFLALFLSVKKISQKNIIYGIIIVGIIFYSIILNGFNVKIITDVLQVANVLLIAFIFKNKNKNQIMHFITNVCYILFFAGVYSWGFYGLKGIRFQPISYVVIILFFYKVVFIKFKWKYFLILVISFLIILYSGRRTNIVLSFIGIAFLFYFFKRRIFNYGFLFFCLLLFNRDNIQESFSKSDYKTLKRLAIKTDKDQSIDTRYYEVKSVFRKFNNANSLTKYTFGFGTGAEYFFKSPIVRKKNEFKHHVHFTPINLYFRHGFLGVIFFMMMVFNTAKGFLTYKDEYLIIITILILTTIVDSLLRSVLVDFFGIFFFGLSFIIKRIR